MKPILTPALALLLCSAAGALAQTSVSGPEGLVLVEMKRLPPVPEPVDVQYCDHRTIEPKTAGGQLAAKLGWAVTGEVSLDGLDAVSFVAGFEPGTSGSCRLIDGNVGLFDGAELRWLVYGEAEASDNIGSIFPFEAGSLRIWNGDFLSQPVADLHLDANDTPSMSALADVETFCDARASVPNIYGRPIGDARKALQKAGWAPVLGTFEDDIVDSHSEMLKANGLIEVQGCSGTGFGYCSFGYAGQFADLTVVTVGEGDAGATPDIVRYDVSCAIPANQ
jgi:hypothetical protein